MSKPPSLWTDRPDPRLEASTDDAPTIPAGPTPSPSATAPRRGSRRVPATLAAVVLLGAGGAGGALLADGEDAPTAAAASAALPAASGSAAPTDIGRIYARASRAVVSVQVRAGSGGGSGTGFLIDSDGTLVTNAHVVDGARSVQVRFDDDGRAVSAEVVGADVSTDLAVLKISSSDIPDGVQPLELTRSAEVEVGDQAIAIGYPLGLDRTATAGIVSGLEREIRAPNGFSIDEVIQTDAPINPGNSGGPLLDSEGRVIGVNSQIATAGGGGGSVGIGFAVPSDTVREVVPRLQAGESIARPYIGVTSAPAASGEGAAVASVSPGSPAQRAGVRAGDILLTVDGEDVSEPGDVAEAIADDEPGDSVRVELRRGGSTQTVTVTLGTRPETSP